MSFKEFFGFNSAKTNKETKPKELTEKELDVLAKRIRIVDPDKRVVRREQEKKAEIRRPVKRKAELTDETSVGISRRGFLKGAAALAGTAVVGGGVLKVIDYFKEEEEAPFDAEEEIPATPEQEKIEEENLRSIEEIINYKKQGKIEFNLQTVENLKKYWEKRYMENEKLRESLVRSFKEMGYWRPYLEKLFIEQGLPKEYIYLAIPESHWQTEAISPARAVGPYQFMKQTALKFGLKMDKAIDERKDPLKSGMACAKLLKYLHEAGGDLGLALSGYNGGQVWGYLSQAKEQNEEPSYEGFVKYMENKINNTREEIQRGQYVYKKFRRGDNLDIIARRYGVSKEEIIKLSGLVDERKIEKNHRLVIPGGERQKEINFKEKMAGLKENLNYPAKFYAVLELIKEGFVKEQEQPISFQTETIKQAVARFNLYQVKKGDTLYGLCKKFNINLKVLRKDNEAVLKGGLKVGSQLKLPGQRPEAVTLANFARKVNRPISRLTFLNPALKINAPIPDGYEVRV